MCRSVLIVMLAVGALIVATTVPAAAERAEKTPYTVAECDFTNLEPGRQWVTGQNNLHIRGAVNQYSEWVLQGETWMRIGTNTTVPSGHVKLPAFEGPFHGTFSLDDTIGIIGDFEGSWSWGNSAVGRASGKEVGGNRLLKATLGLDPAAIDNLPEELPGNGDCLLARYIVIDPHG